MIVATLRAVACGVLPEYIPYPTWYTHGSIRMIVPYNRCTPPHVLLSLLVPTGEKFRIYLPTVSLWSVIEDYKDLLHFP